MFLLFLGRVQEKFQHAKPYLTGAFECVDVLIVGQRKQRMMLILFPLVQSSPSGGDLYQLAKVGA
jgi:hypothetical protein